MARARLAALVLVMALLAACSSSTAAYMPRLEGKRLDVAYSELDAAGVNRADVEIVGGGTFGVVDESNWSVCRQSPSAGAQLDRVRLVIDRSCAIGVPTNPVMPRDESQGANPTPTVAESSVGDQGSEVAESFVMPSVVGMVLQDAQDLLQSMGSYLMDQVDATGYGRMQLLDSNWKVCSQNPSAGATVSIAQIVTLSAVKLSESC